MTDLTIEETKRVWVAWTNTDLTEGKGCPVVKAVAETPETARRLGHKGSVMGSDCYVSEEIAVKARNMWLVPGRIVPETDEDKALRLQREARESAAAKARAAGLSDEDIAALIGRNTR